MTKDEILAVFAQGCWMDANHQVRRFVCGDGHLQFWSGTNWVLTSYAGPHPLTPCPDPSLPVVEPKDAPDAVAWLMRHPGRKITDGDGDTYWIVTSGDLSTLVDIDGDSKWLPRGKCLPVGGGWEPT